MITRCTAIRKQCQTCICDSCGPVGYGDPCEYSGMKGCPGAYSKGGCAGFSKDDAPCKDGDGLPGIGD